MRTTALEDPPRGGNFLAGKRKELLVLTGRRGSVSDGPVDRTVVGQNHEGRTCFRAGDRTFRAYRFLEVLGEGASGVKDVALDRVWLSVAGGSEGNGEESKKEG